MENINVIKQISEGALHLELSWQYSIYWSGSLVSFFWKKKTWSTRLLFVNLSNFNKVISRIGGKSITFCPFLHRKKTTNPSMFPSKRWRHTIRSSRPNKPSPSSEGWSPGALSRSQMLNLTDTRRTRTTLSSGLHSRRCISKSFLALQVYKIFTRSRKYM